MSFRSKLTAVVLSVAALAACTPAVTVAPPKPVPPVAKASAPMVPDADRVTVVLHADVAFTKSERAALEWAAEVWRQQTQGLADIRIVYDLDFNSVSTLKANVDNNVLIRFTSDIELIQKMDCKHAEAMELPCGTGEGPKVLGFVYPPGGVNAAEQSPIRMGIVSDRVTGDGRLEGVTLHELGHVLGIAHLKERSSIMFPAYSDGRKACLKSPDLDAYCRAQACGSVAMKPCE